MCALFGGTEKRPFQINAPNGCLGTAAAGGGLQQQFSGIGHQGGQYSGDAVVQIAGRHLRQLVLVRMVKVKTGAAVAVHIHQTGQDAQTAAVRTFAQIAAQCGDFSVFHSDITDFKAVFQENRSVFQDHSLSPLKMPPFGSSKGGKRVQF